jgi:hypothetical protein
MPEWTPSRAPRTSCAAGTLPLRSSCLPGANRETRDPDARQITIGDDEQPGKTVLSTTRSAAASCGPQNGARRPSTLQRYGGPQVRDCDRVASSVQAAPREGARRQPGLPRLGRQHLDGLLSVLDHLKDLRSGHVSLAADPGTRNVTARDLPTEPLASAPKVRGSLIQGVQRVVVVEGVLFAHTSTVRRVRRCSGASVSRRANPVFVHRAVTSD